MFGWLDPLWWFLDRVGTAIWLALQFSPDLLQRVERNPWSGAVIAMVTLLGGGSLLLGQSAILFLNRVSPRRFVLALSIGALQYLLALIGWGAIIWLVGTLLFAETPPLRVTIRLVGLGSAPYVFGVFVLIPYLGTLIGRLLATWSLLIVLNAMAFTFGVSYAAALVCIGLGWLVWLLLEATLGRPILRVQRWLWIRFAGPYHDVPPQQRHAWLLARMPKRPVQPNHPHQDALQKRGQAGGWRHARHALQVGLHPDRLEEYAQGRRLLPGRRTADAGRLSDNTLAASGVGGDSTHRDGAADAGRPGHS